MRRASSIARFAAAVRARYARGLARRMPFAPVVRRALRRALAVALQQHVYVSVGTPWHVVHRRVEGRPLALPGRPDVRPPAMRALVLERLLTRRERVERSVPREVVRQAPHAGGAAAPAAVPSASLPSAPGALRSPTPAATPSPPPAMPDIERLTADVIRAIDRRIIAQRERLGRV